MTSAELQSESPVRVSVAIPTYNAAAHLEAAVRSALDQTISDIEVLIVDDCSSDDTVALAQRLAAQDNRVQVDRLPQNGGPSMARNRALQLARGQWFAVLDSDDLYASNRLQLLIARAEADGADIIADNMIVFDSDEPALAAYFLKRESCDGWLTLESYLRRTVMYSPEPNLGYLKPVMRIGKLRKLGIAYDPLLRIGEDDDLIVRMLIAGLQYRLVPDATYAYRRHAASTSHRLSAANADAMAEASRDLLARAGALGPAISEATRARHQAFERAAGFARLIDRLKARDPLGALRAAMRNPAVLPLLQMPLAAAIRRLVGNTQIADFGETDPAAAAELKPIVAKLTRVK